MVLTKDLVSEILAKNEGFTLRRNHLGDDGEYMNYYTITNGKVMRRSGKDNTTVELNLKETRCFLMTTKFELGLDGAPYCI